MPRCIAIACARAPPTTIRRCATGSSPGPPSRPRWVIKAQKFRRWYRQEVLRLFDDVDIVLAPSTPCRAPRIGQATFVLDGVTLPVRANLGIFTQPVSFIGLPVAAVPVWLDAGLPLGVQVIAAPWREDLALRVARELEKRGAVRAPVARL